MRLDADSLAGVAPQNRGRHLIQGQVGGRLELCSATHKQLIGRQFHADHFAVLAHVHPGNLHRRQRLTDAAVGGKHRAATTLVGRTQRLQLTFNFPTRGLRFAKLRRRILQLPLQQRHLLSRDLILLSTLGELRVEIAIVGVELAGAAIQLRKLSLVRLLLPRLLPARRGICRGERIVVAAKLPGGDRHP